jgi:alpha-tubulin suppressor-like RCC1 family protein
MKRGSRHLPAYGRGRRRVGALGIGLAAVLSLVWGQQPTLASFVDGEFAASEFTARTLQPITPTTTGGHASSIDVSWPAADGDWATPTYTLSTAATNTGTGAYDLYSGGDTSYTHRSTDTAPTTGQLRFTAVAAGTRHACGIVRGEAYCWGTSTVGALGGATSPASSPTVVAALSGKLVTAISAGNDRSCAIADGNVYCWGTGIGATPTAVTGIPGTPTSLSSGGSQSCAVANGGAFCWTATTATAVAGGLSNRTVSSVSVGSNHACAVADGMAFCWGTNTYGQLGDGTTVDRTTPTLAWGGEITGRQVSEISAGDAHTCAIADDKAFCWGAGGSGRLGNGSTVNRTTAVAVSGISGKVSAITAGYTHSCAVAAGDAYCWGSTPGNGSTANQTTAVALTSGTLAGRTLGDISAGNGFSCAVGDSPAACWGLGTSGQLGNAASVTSVTPVDADLAGPSCGDGAVRRSDGTCSLVQGSDYYYQLGYTIGAWHAPNSSWVKRSTTTRPAVSPAVDSRTQNSITMSWDPASERAQSYGQYQLQRSTSSNGSSPATVATTGDTTWTDDGGFALSRDFTKVSAGGSHSCGIVAGSLYCWGENGSGQLGIGNTTDQAKPTLVGGALASKTVTDVTAGGSHTCAVTDDDTLYCWGLNSSGQLGVGNNTSQRTPQQVATGVNSVSAGANHTCAVQSGTVYCWGSNGSGQLGLGNTTNQSSPQAVANTQRCVFWFFCSTVFDNTSVTSVAAGDAHSCVVRGGVVYCWGLGTSGQLGNGSNTTSTLAVQVSNGNMTNSGVSTITAGGAHTCALRSSRAYCWGSDSSGQLGNNNAKTNVNTPASVSNLTSVTDISAGGSHTCAVNSGQAYCWGENSDGQLGLGTTADATTPAAVSASGALTSASVISISAGTTHSCLVAGGNAYCFGNATQDDRLGLGGSSSVDITVPTQVYQGARCAADQTLLGNGTCSLAAGTTYYYRVTFSLDGTTTTAGNWVGLATGP